jgi:putative ABC transport system permease protein
MKLLNKLTFQDLRLNKKRTMITIVGIILATALLAAVSTMAGSFRYSLLEYKKTVNGNYHYAFLQVPEEKTGWIENNRNVESYYEVAGIGYASLPESKNELKPYLYLEAMDENALLKSSVNLVEGRLPENDSEVLISKHIKTNGGVDYKVGDTLTLTVGYRLSEEDGSILNQHNPYEEEETFLPSFEKTYTVVGITERLSMVEEDQMAPGYTIITFAAGNTNPLENTYDSVDIYARYTKEALKNRDKVTKEMASLDTTHILTEENRDVIRMETLDFSNSTLSFVYVVAGIVIAIIIVTSAFCIRNSFAISITEKMKQYGMLASVGATPGQIKKNVYYEAVLLGSIGIPLGILSGIFACFVVIKIIAHLLADFLSMQLIFSVSGFAIALTVVFSVAVILLSAASPARKAAKVSPIAAISGRDEKMLSQKELKVPVFLKKIFGMGGVIAYKNRKRSKKKYRVVTLSIAVSVTVFLALFSFINQMFDWTGHYYSDSGYNIGIDYYSYEDFSGLAQLDGINRASVMKEIYFAMKISDISYSKEGKQNMNGYDEDSYIGIHLISLGDTEYRTFLQNAGISEEKAREGAVLVDDGYRYDTEKKKYETYRLYTYEAGDVLTGKLEEWDEEESCAIPITAVTDERPFGLENVWSNVGYLVVSDDWMLAHEDSWEGDGEVYLDCDDPDAMQEILADEFPEVNIYNEAQSQREEHSMYLVIAIFLYGFITVISLIGITNIFNTVTTSMEMRSKEFAMLRSIGMTRREFKRMVCLESVFYGGKALIIGLFAGNLLAYAIYCAMAGEIASGFSLPYLGMGIAILAVVLLLAAIMAYSLAQVRRQNIIETIRRDYV